MILLITPSAKAQECIPALQEATSESAHAANSFRQAATLLRAQEYSAVVFDQALLDAEPGESEVALEHIGSAIPVYVNFAISGTERVVRELRAALQRRKREVTAARRAAEESFRNDLKGNVTAMLLSCEMALKTPELPEAAESKVRTVYEQALELRDKLGVGG
jgi:hypothetical protein